MAGREKVEKGHRKEGFHALKMQRALTPITYKQRTSTKERLRELDSFQQFPLLQTIQESISTQALSGLHDISPTPIQRLAIPALLGSKERGRKSHLRSSPDESKPAMQQYLLAAETGSGKTLAYLLPTIDAVKRAEMLEAGKMGQEETIREEERSRNSFELDPGDTTNQPHPTTGRPRAIILLPTSELVTQVGNVTKLLSHTVKYRSALISSAYSGRVIRNRLFAPTGIDVLVSTPHLLASIAENDPNILSRVTHLVIDEADSLLDRSFAPNTSAIIDKATPSLRQLILCSATIPRSLDGYLRQRFPDIQRLVTPNLHAIPRRVQLGVVDVEKDPYRGNKNLACADTIWQIGKAAADHSISHGKVEKDKLDVKRIIVFANEREKTVEVAEYLRSKGVDAVALNRDTPEQRQSEILASFTNPAPEKPDDNAVPLTQDDARTFVPLNAPAQPRRTLPLTKVLVATDLGSRGIDTLAVRHVVLYDVPHSTIDFIHRLGRTGRMGRRGRGIVLVGKDDRRDVVREVREGMFKGQALI